MGQWWKRSRSRRQRDGGVDEKVNTPNNHWAVWEWWRWYRCPFIFRGVCVRVRVLYLGFSFSWPKSSAFRMPCTPGVCIVYCVLCMEYLFAAFLVFEFFLCVFFSVFVFITLILTFLFLHSLPFFVQEYLWEFVGLREWETTIHNSIHNRIIDF